MSATPLCDAVLATPIDLPPGLGSALQNVERTARGVRDRLRAVEAAGRAVSAVSAALARLDAFLDDRQRSPLVRALRRPLHQVALGTPGWRRLESAWRSAVLRGNAALRLQEAVEELAAEVERIAARFGHDLPYWTAFHLEREGVTPARVRALRRDDAKKPLRERLRRVEGELERLRAAFPPEGVLAQVHLAASWPDRLTPGEMLAAAMLRLGERSSSAGPAAVPSRHLRRAAARHLHALGGASGWTRIARRPEHTLAQQMANTLLSADAEVEYLDDAPLWSGLLGAARDSLHAPARSRDAWAPQLAGADAADAEVDWGATHFAIPLSPDYVLLAPDAPSAIRIVSRRIALDAEVECQAFSAAAGFETLGEARREVEPLFDGLGAGPGWYRTTRPAKLTVIARAGGRWIARLDARGELADAGTPAWRASAPRDARLRVLLDGVSAPLAGPVPVGALEGDAVEFGGIVLRQVDAPFASVRRAWLKTAGEDGEARLETEHAFFRAAARHLPTAVPRLLGRGTLERPREDGYLYAPPLAFTEAESPPLARWMAENPVLFVAAAARLGAALLRAGLSLGVYHRAALAFRMEWGPDALPRPVAVVAMAPFASALGAAPERLVPGPGAWPEYPGLGLRLLAVPAVTGQSATPESEARAWALFALDLLAVKRLPSGVRSHDAIAQLAAENGEAYFRPPAVAARFGAALADGGRARTLMESLARAGEPAERS